jgi:hypothetical protein
VSARRAAGVARADACIPFAVPIVPQATWSPRQIVNTSARPFRSGEGHPVPARPHPVREEIQDVPAS